VTDQHKPLATASDEQARPERRTWQTPRLQHISAGSAEVGSNPARPEGPFGSGS
jgi:hypothetical protein